MKKPGFFVITIFFAMFLSAGCTSVQMTNTKAVKSMRSDLMALTSSIKTVNVSTYMDRADINVFFTDNPTKEVTDAVLDRVKEFSTVDNLKDFVSTLMTLHLCIYTDNDKETPTFIYRTSYYNSSDLTDDSPSNVNGYKTWTQSK